MLEILNAHDGEQLEQVRNLMHAFVDWLRQHYPDDIHSIDEYFDQAAFKEELLSLPGEYSRPEGQLLLALHAGQPAGCVGLRKFDAYSCEMKRLFVSPEFHRQGIGRSLVKTLIQNAKAFGYSSMRLETGIDQTAAQRLYGSLGFKRIRPYHALSKNIEKILVSMELCL